MVYAVKLTATFTFFSKFCYYH